MECYLHHFVIPGQPTPCWYVLKQKSHCTRRATEVVCALHVFKWRPLLIAATFTLTPDRDHCQRRRRSGNKLRLLRATHSFRSCHAPNSPNGSSFTMIQKYALSNFQLQTRQWQTLIMHRRLTQSTSVTPSLCSRHRANTCGKLKKIRYILIYI
jgi:hypothetical protein